MKKTCLMSVDIASVIFVFVLLLLGSIIQNHIEKLNYNAVESIGKNWNQGPITQFRNNQDSDVCPNHSNFFINDNWPGIVDGCYCPGSKSVSKGLCSVNQQKEKCESVKSIPSIRYKGWRRKSLCVSRINKSYLDLNVIPFNETCGQGLKDCGGIDTIGNKLCSDECPVKRVKVVDDSVQALPEGSYSIPMSENKKLVVYPFDQYGKAIIDLKISDGVPCANPDELNYNVLYPLHPYHERKQCVTKINNSTLDYRYVQIDSYSKEKLFRENEIFKTLENIPGFPFESLNKEVTSLFYREYVGITKSCREFSVHMANNTDLIISRLSNVKSTMDESKASHYIKIVVIVFCFVVMLLYSTKILLFLTRDFKEFHLYRSLINCFVSIACCAFLIAGVLCLITIQKIIIYYGWLLSHQCLDEFYSAVLSNFDSEMRVVQALLIAFNLISAFVVLSPLTELFFPMEVEVADSGVEVYYHVTEDDKIVTEKENYKAKTSKEDKLL